MDAKEAKEIIGAGFAWANWTDEQKQAFELAYKAIDEVNRLKKELIKANDNLKKIEKAWREGNDIELDETLEELFN